MRFCPGITNMPEVGIRRPGKDRDLVRPETAATVPSSVTTTPRADRADGVVSDHVVDVVVADGEGQRRELAAGRSPCPPAAAQVVAARRDVGELERAVGGDHRVASCSCRSPWPAPPASASTCAFATGSPRRVEGAAANARHARDDQREVGAGHFLSGLHA